MVSRTSPVPMFVTATLAPGTTAPPGSVTVPVSEPRSDWALATHVHGVSTHNIIAAALRIFMVPPDFDLPPT
ncbi:MAG: hypothetical protein H0T92_19750 [Pyrinomonadaceae bacterium]|nr:hypothetical protein [Pyrinomonadaceae bacterium]